MIIVAKISKESQGTDPHRQNLSKLFFSLTFPPASLTILSKNQFTPAFLFSLPLRVSFSLPNSAYFLVAQKPIEPVKRSVERAVKRKKKIDYNQISEKISQEDEFARIKSSDVMSKK